jgi:hypothetical protein
MLSAEVNDESAANSAFSHSALARTNLSPLEIDDRATIVQVLAELAVARIGQIALRLDHFEVGGHADVELALRRLGALDRQLTRRGRGLDRFERIADGDGRRGDFRRDL